MAVLGSAAASASSGGRYRFWGTGPPSIVPFCFMPTLKILIQP